MLCSLPPVLQPGHVITHLAYFESSQTRTQTLVGMWLPVLQSHMPLVASQRLSHIQVINIDTSLNYVACITIFFSFMTC